MSVSSHTGLFGSRAAVAKLCLPAHCGYVQMTGRAFIWCICKGSKYEGNKTLFI